MFRNNVDDAELERRRSVLRARGVPEHFIENLATRHGTLLAWRYTPIGLMFIGCALSVIAYVLFSKWQALNVELPGLAALHARGAVFASYAHWQGFAFLPALFGLMCIPLWLFQVLVANPKRYPAADVASVWLRSLQPLEEKEGIIAPLPAQFIESSKTPEDLIRVYNGASVRITTGIVVTCFIVSCGSYFLTANQYWAVMPDRVVAKGFGAERAYLFTDSEAVSVGCNHGSQDSIKYVMHFEAASFDIPRADNGLPPAEVFRRLEGIDRTLRSIGIRRERWKWLVQDPMAPACLDYWSQQAGSDGRERLLKLLQVTS